MVILYETTMSIRFYLSYNYLKVDSIVFKPNYCSTENTWLTWSSSSPCLFLQNCGHIFLYTTLSNAFVRIYMPKIFSDVLESLDKAIFGLRDLNAETLLLKYLLSKQL